MYLPTSPLLLVFAAAVASVSGTPLGERSICEGETVVSESFIGKDKNVKVQQISCASTKEYFQPRAVLNSRQTNVCGATCATNCFTPSGGGPNPNECHVIADALRYESQNTGAIFPIGTGAGNNTIAMTYRSCFTFFVNQDLASLAYCRTDWADVMDWVAPNCQAAQNAHGGNCVATDQRWFIQYVNKLQIVIEGLTESDPGFNTPKWQEVFEDQLQGSD